MLARSFGAGSFAGFWRHWNPIWGYGLGRYVFAPAQRVIPPWLALIATFLVSGLIHDAVVMLLRREPAFVFTIWFAISALGIIASDRIGWNFAHWPRLARTAVIAAYLAAGLLVSLLVDRA